MDLRLRLPATLPGRPVTSLHLASSPLALYNFCPLALTLLELLACPVCRMHAARAARQPDAARVQGL